MMKIMIDDDSDDDSSNPTASKHLHVHQQNLIVWVHRR